MEKTIKTLIVDDDYIVRTFMMKLIINKFGYDVIQAGNGIEALKALEHDDPDIVFLDISMPLMNGIEFLSTVRNHAKYKNLPIIAITAHSDKATVKQLVDLGIQDYILKPLSYNETYARLREIIAEYKGMISKNRVKKEIPDEEKPKQKLLLIDADKSFRNFLRRLLSFEFDILEGSSSAECLDLYVKHEPGFVFISLELNATIDNFLLNKLRELDTSEAITVFATTYSENRAANTRGYNGVLVKSFFPSKMMQEISGKFYNHKKIGFTYLHILNQMGKEKLKEVVKYIFDSEAGMVLTKKPAEIFSAVSQNLQTSKYLVNSDSSVFLKLLMTGEDNCVLNLKSKDIPSDSTPLKKLNFLTEAVCDYLRYELEKFGINLSGKTVVEKDIDLSLFDKKEIKFHFESDENDLYQSFLFVYVKK